jgi:prepilin-type N-terminal cleavage/methylation domain-containing protein
MTKRTGARGFSLIELLVAMSIFSVMGIAIVTLLARASEFSRSGSSTTETLDALQTFTETFTADVSGLYSRADSDDRAPDVRLWSDVVKSDVNGDGKPDAPIRRLMFVRMVPDEASGAVTRPAGSVVGAKEYYDLKDDYAEAVGGKLRATRGLMEVFWTAVPEDAANPAVMTVYRGVRSPIGRKDPFPLFPSRSASDPAARGPVERGPVDLPEIRQVARPLLSGVLYFGLDFWSRRTQTWDPSQAPPEGPLSVWDSTRGVMPKGKGFDGFWFAKSSGAQEKPTLDDPTDDTYPRKVRVTMVVEESGQAARTGMLLEDLPPDATFMEISDTAFLPAIDTTRRYVKVDAEWIEFQGIETGRRITGCKRGARGTTPALHARGAKVHHGRTIVREIAVATFRDAYRDELPAITGRR